MAHLAVSVLPSAAASNGWRGFDRYFRIGLAWSAGLLLLGLSPLHGLPLVGSCALWLARDFAENGFSVRGGVFDSTNRLASRRG
jgi:hypothetical protein